MHKAFFITIGAIAVLAAGFFALNAYIYSEKQADPAETVESYRGTLSGEYVCLPSNDPNDSNDECVLGLKTDVGEYFLVDFNMYEPGMPQMVPGERFSAQGLITPIEMLSTDQWRKYPLEGVFSITDSFQKM